MRGSLAERFWAKVNRRGPNECWPWTAGKFHDGYGGISSLRAHRLSWELAHGKIPQDLHVLHHCDNPICMNPAHLFLGTHADNMADLKQKEKTCRGERQGRHKLTKADVRAIRNATYVPFAVLAEVFGISKQHAWAVKTGREWPWLS